MTHNEIYLSLVGRILSESPASRLYTSVPVEQTFIDLLAVTHEALVGYLILSDVSQLDTLAERQKALSQVCTVNYASTSFAMAEQVFALLPDSWGLVSLTPDMVATNAWAAVEHAGDPASQLALLWENELKDLLSRYDIPLVGHRSAQFLRDHILKRLDPSIISQGVALELLYRNYDAAGQPDLTFWSPALEKDAAWDELYPKSRPHATPMSLTQAAPKTSGQESILPMGLLEYGNAPKSGTIAAPRKEADKPRASSKAAGSAASPQRSSRSHVDPILDRLFSVFPYEDDGALYWADEDPFETPPPARGPYDSWFAPAQHEEYPVVEGAQKAGSRRNKASQKLLVPDELQEVPGTAAEPKWVPWQEIEVWPGVPWIPEDLIEEFVAWLRYGDQKGRSRSYFWYRGKKDVRYDPSTGIWYIDNKGAFINSTSYRRLESRFGIDGYNALRIFESMLNLRQIRLESEERTAAALERQDLILESFQHWLFATKERRERVEKLYNETFSAYQKRTYDGSKLTFPGLAKDVSLYSYQKDAVAQILSERNTLLAFDVGAGKTYIMIAAAMKLRGLDPGTKNMFVVPNNIVGQWESIFRSMYANARLLVVDPKTFKPADRNRILEDIRDNDYDGIIMAYSCFELIKLSNREIAAQRHEDLEHLNQSSGGFPTYSMRAPIARAATAAVKRSERVMKSVGTDDEKVITLEQLGITMLYLDEAHNYKNVPIRSSLKTVAGLNLTGSIKCLSMYYKIRAIQESEAGRGVVFATGTPLSNSLVDCYTMQMYLQREEMEAQHFDIFDNWIKSFARPESVCEIDVDTARFRYVNRLAFFHNLPELSRMFSMNATFYAMDEKDDIPELFGYTNVLIDRYKALEGYMKDIVRRTERIRTKKVPPMVDNMLKISTDGRKAALDLRLVDREQPKKNSKITACVEKVLDIYWQDDSFTQIIFCDYSTPKKTGFTVYAELKKQLMAAGVPEKEIEFVHTATNTAKKMDLFDKVNRGDIRILIGSTFKLGIGANVQTHLKAVHHLDIPWRPADMVQREGRILRKGNSNDRVKIFRYIAEGSFDSYCWQLLENKQKFISQFLSGAAYDRTIQDLEDNVLTYAQVKALAISEPLMKDLAEKQNALRRLRLVSNNFEQDRRERDKGLGDFYSQRKKLEKYARNTEENAAYLRSTYDATYFKQLYKSIGSQFDADFLQQPEHESMELCGFSVRFPGAGEQNPKHPYLYLERLGEEYRLKLSKSALGNARRIVNFFKNFDSSILKPAQDNVSKLQDRIQGRETISAAENPYVDQIAALEKEIHSLREQIMLRSQTT